MTWYCITRRLGSPSLGATRWATFAEAADQADALWWCNGNTKPHLTTRVSAAVLIYDDITTDDFVYPYNY